MLKFNRVIDVSEPSSQGKREMRVEVISDGSESTWIMYFDSRLSIEEMTESAKSVIAAIAESQQEKLESDD